jgi:hypothetical protein
LGTASSQHNNCMQNVIQLLQSGFAENSVVFAHTQTRLVINVDKNTAYPPAVDDLKADEHLPEASELRQMLPAVYSITSRFRTAP